MKSPQPATVDRSPAQSSGRNGTANGTAQAKHGHAPATPRVPDPETMRRWAWTIGEERAGDGFVPPGNHAALGVVAPYHGFAHWRIKPEWVEQVARQKGDAWHHCALVLRLYDVSYIHFNGFNAHAMLDVPLPALCGHLFFHLSRPGTTQLGEVGFRLRNGEFIPAARSQPVEFPRDAAAPYPSQVGLLVDEHGRVEEIANLWEQDRILYERRKPRLRGPLRIGVFTFVLPALEPDGSSARFIAELLSGEAGRGHEVHLFLPATDGPRFQPSTGQVHYHPLAVPDGSPLERARRFAELAEQRLRDLPPLDLIHIHEWMAGFVAEAGNRPTLVSLTSVEATRCQSSGPGPLFSEIQQAEQQVARRAGAVLVPNWLHEKANAELGVDGSRIHPFPMEARLPSEWESPLDLGQVKRDIGLGPLDRLLLFIGPLEYAAGPDLLLEALPVVLPRVPQLRIAFAGAGSMHGSLQHRAHQLGIAGVVRFLGHVERPALVRLMRAAEALVLPSRYRVPWDDAVVDLARLAGRPVITTRTGPAHLVAHEQNGIVTYDNPGSMVWAMDRILQDPLHGEHLGRSGKRYEGAAAISWDAVVDRYLDLCAAAFPELRAGAVPAVASSPALPTPPPADHDGLGIMTNGRIPMTEPNHHAPEGDASPVATEPLAPPATPTTERNGESEAALETPQAPVPESPPPEPPRPETVREARRAESKRARRRRESERTHGGPPVIAAFCYELPGSAVGQHLAHVAAALARRSFSVHIFAREKFDVPGVHCHAVGNSGESDLVDSAYEFGQRAGEAFRAKVPAGAPVTLLGCEWSAISAMVQLRLSEPLESILLLHSLERQRSDLSSPLSRRIEELELAGLRDARGILVNDAATAEAARKWVPECAARLACMGQPFPTEPFAQELDPGTVKARYQIGPLDPVVLFIGDMDERHGADVLMKTVTPVLRNHPQARFVFVGQGELYWPLRVHSRYLLLEHAVRLLGHVEGRALFDLIQAADVIAVPSREATEWWPVQVAWAAGRPAIVSHPVGEAMQLHHEQDCVLVYPHESSCVWGIERVIFDANLRSTLAARGKEALETRFGWGGIAQQIEEIAGIKSATAAVSADQ